MRFVLDVFLVVLAGAVLSVCGRSQTPREICGTGGTILNSTTINHNGNKLKFTITSCPALSASRSGNSGTAVSGNLNKRQVQQSCTEAPEACIVECIDFGGAPVATDCQVITGVLEEQEPNLVLAPAGTDTSVSFATCEFSFLNIDTEDYDICLNFFGINGAVTAETCFGSVTQPGITTGGACITPEVFGNDWAIVVSDPRA